MNKKFATILASAIVGLTSIGTGLSAWVYNSSTEKGTDVDSNINDFKFSTLTIKESTESANGVLSKIGNTVHNYRCDNKDLGYTNAVIDVCEYFSITSDDESNLSKAKYKVVEGSGSISGDELTFGDIAGNVVVRCYEEGCEDNYFDLTFVNSVSTSIAEHQYKTTYGTIAWGDWSTTATYSSNNQHTRSRTGTLPYETKCEICSTKKDSGNLTIDSSNYSTYSVYNTDSNTYIKTESCTEDSGTSISDSRTWSYGTKNYTGYEQYSSTSSLYSEYHKHTYTKSYSYTSGYGSGYKYYCTDCSHLMRDTRTYYSADSDTISSYDKESHNFSEDDKVITYGEWEDYSSTQHRRLVTTTTTKTCSDCGYSTSSDSSTDEYADHNRNGSSGYSSTTTDYTQYNANYHYRNYTYRYTSIYCTTCSHDFGSSSGSSKSLQAHTFTSNSSSSDSYGSWENYSSTQHRRLVTTTKTITYTCSKCNYSYSEDGESTSSYEYENHIVSTGESRTDTSTSYGTYSYLYAVSVNSSQHRKYYKRYNTVYTITYTSHDCSKCSYSYTTSSKDSGSSTSQQKTELESHSLTSSTSTSTGTTTWGSKSYTGYTSAGSSGHYHNWSQTGTYVVTTTTTKTCSDCNYSNSSSSDSTKTTSKTGNDGLSSHTFQTYSGGSHSCGGTFVKTSQYGITDSDGNTTYSWKCKSCGATKQSATGGTCSAKITLTSTSCKYCGYAK